jgi:hypothetical protein
MTDWRSVQRSNFRLLTTSHSSYDEDFRSKANAELAIQSTFPVSHAAFSDQVVGSHKIGRLAGLNCGFRQRHRQMSLSSPGGPSKMTVDASCTNWSVRS